MINDWNLGFNAYAWIRHNIYNHSTILELGSGEVSWILARDYHIYSVEHNLDYINKHEDVNYIFSRIVDGWYRMPQEMKNWPDSYDLLIIDGPTGKIGRSGILNHLHLFDLSKPILLDDVHRNAERALAHELSKVTGRKFRIYPDGKKEFAII